MMGSRDGGHDPAVYAQSCGQASCRRNDRTGPERGRELDEEEGDVHRDHGGHTRPDHAVGFAFCGSKTLLSAVELGLFTELATGPLDAETLRQRLGIHPRGARDFFDALVALGMLERRGDRYRNTPGTDLFLDRAEPSYSGGFLEMASGRLYGFWASLIEALRTGRPQNEAKTGGDFFGALYGDPARLKGFARAITGISMGTARVIARRFPWSRHRTFADVDTAEGCLPVRVALAHPHLGGVGFDLPPLGPSSTSTSPRPGCRTGCGCRGPTS